MNFHFFLTFESIFVLILQLRNKKINTNKENIKLTKQETKKNRIDSEHKNERRETESFFPLLTPIISGVLFLFLVSKIRLNL